MKVLVLAGGADQIALIQELKDRGHEVVLVDYFDNPPAKYYADKHIVASTLDTERVREIAEKECVSLICTACTDQALLTVANVSEQLNLLCYLSYEKGLNVTNKLYMKKVMVEHNIPTAQYAILDKVDPNAVSSFHFPVVVKPVDCNSSKGVKRVESYDELCSALSDAIQYSRTKTAIVEEFKRGEEISADFYISKGKVEFLSATKSKKIPNRKSFTILSSEYPAISKEQTERLIGVAERIAIAFQLDNCPLLIQLIVGDDELSVIEFSARMGGGSKYKLIEVLSGVNIMSKYVDRVLGEYPEVVPTYCTKHCKMVYLYCNAGVFDKVEGLAELKERGEIVEYFVYKTRGAIIEHAETSSDRAAGYLVVAESEQALRSKIAYIDSFIRVISTEGRDIMMHNLLGYETN